MGLKVIQTCVATFNFKMIDSLPTDILPIICSYLSDKDKLQIDSALKDKQQSLEDQAIKKYFPKDDYDAVKNLLSISSIIKTNLEKDPGTEIRGAKASALFPGRTI